MKKVLVTLGGLLAAFVVFVVFSNIVMSPEHKARFDAERAVRANLRDGASAQFGETAAYRSRAGLIIVCGTVNAKNAFGGYPGPQRFIRIGHSDAVLLEETGQEGFEGVWNLSCTSSAGV